MGGKGFTAMMPKGTAESMAHSYEISQASPMAQEVHRGARRGRVRAAASVRSEPRRPTPRRCRARAWRAP